MSEYQFNIESEGINEKEIAWKEARCGKFTSSQIAKLMTKGTKGNRFGEKALTYIYKKIAETITLEYNEISSAAIKWGNEHEADAVKMYSSLKNVECEHYGKANPIFLPHGNHAGGSPDGFVITHDATLEVKCPFESGNHMEVFHLIHMNQFDLKKWDAEYYGQCQFNMYLQKKKSARFVSYDPRAVDYRFSIAEAIVPYDEAYVKELLERLEEAVKIKVQYLTDLGYYAADELEAAA